MSDQPPKPKPKPKLRVTFAEGQMQGNYVNLAMVAHTPTEFVADFAFVPPGVPEAKVASRIIMNPVNAKRLLGALQENIKRYEKRFGEIDTKIGGPEPTLH